MIVSWRKWPDIPTQRPNFLLKNQHLTDLETWIKRSLNEFLDTSVDNSRDKSLSWEKITSAADLNKTRDIDIKVDHK